MTTLAQYTEKETALNKLKMFETRVKSYSLKIKESRENNNSVLENIFINELIQCEKMVVKCKQEYNQI
jgi:hypothetical protein